MVVTMRAIYAIVALGVTATPSTMRAVTVKRNAPEGDWSQVAVVTDKKVPKPGQGEVLIKVAASSVNPVDWKLFESLYDAATTLGLNPKVPGFDVSGVIEAVGDGCSRLKVGDAVWADLGKGKVGPGKIQLGAWAEFAVADESQVGVKPESLSFEGAASLPLVGLTDLQAFKMTGAPWADRTNVTVVVTSGSGGTGVVAIQLAKAWGATRIVTSASPRNHQLLKDLGATHVVDYHESTIWETLDDDSVDVVYDNYGAAGTADAAMASFKSDGTFIFLPGKGGDLSKQPKEGVTQINYGLCNSSKHEELDELAALADAGKLRSVVPESYVLEDILQALTYSVGGHALGKIGINISSLESMQSVLV